MSHISLAYLHVAIQQNSSRSRFEISVNMDISILEFYGFIENIDGYFDKNINNTKMIQNS